MSWAHEHAGEVLQVLSTRRTQTNEVTRCATLRPALALLPQPLALIEVGASAGLCLLYDRWRYCPAPLILLISGRIEVWHGRGDPRPGWC